MSITKFSIVAKFYSPKEEKDHLHEAAELVWDKIQHLGFTPKD